MPISRCAASIALHGLAQRRARREVERQRHRRELAGVVDDQPRVALLDARDARERHLLAVARGDVDLSQRLRPDLVARRGLEHHAILVRLRVDRRNQPLPERVVQRVVDGRDAHAEPARRIAIDGEEGLQPAILQVAGDVGQRRDLLQPIDQLRHPLAQAIRVRILEDELELRAADPILDRQVLHGLEVERDPGHLLQARPQALDDRRGRPGPLLVRLERDEHAPAVERRVAAVHADEG